MSGLPLVSIIIPCRNEEKFIRKCLDSIIGNDYSKDRIEVLVVDGISDDGTGQVVCEYAECHPFVRLLENPKGIVSSGMNIGIKAARGEVIIRMDAHATYAPDYIRQCVAGLQTTGAANVGGVQRAVGTGYTSNAIAIATTFPFGTGDARFRYSNREEWVETVYLGAWYKITLEALGGFDEQWIVNQDYELNYRLRQIGGKILLSPMIRCEYYVRDSLKAVARQYFRYGFWKVKTLVAHPDSLRWRQLVPPDLVLALGLSASLLPFYPLAGMIIPGVYTTSNLVASIQAARRKGWRYLLLLPLVFTTIHLSWGVGFWAGIIRFGVPRLSWKSLIHGLCFARTKTEVTNMQKLSDEQVTAPQDGKGPLGKVAPSVHLRSHAGQKPSLEPPSPS